MKKTNIKKCPECKQFSLKQFKQFGDWSCSICGYKKINYKQPPIRKPIFSTLGMSKKMYEKKHKK